MKLVLDSLVGLLAGILASMGMGAGSVLLIYLMSFTNTQQLKAQGINLLFFIPIGLVSIIMHRRNNLIEKKAFLYTFPYALVFSAIGAVFSKNIDKIYMRKLLGIYFLYIGIREIFSLINKKRT